MRKFGVLAALAICAGLLAGCTGPTAGEQVKLDGSLCIGGICITGPQVSRVAPVAPNRGDYNRAVAARSAAVACQPISY